MAQKIRNKPILRLLAFLSLLCWVTAVATPITWIWFGWSLAWKILITVMIGGFIFRIIYIGVKQAILENQRLK